MNWEHLKAFLWLRWRLVANRNRRAGAGSVILQTILTAIMMASGVLAFILGIAFGYLALPRLSSGNFMLVWDSAVAGFLFFWMIELLVELQRSELLSLDKFLHLPVSLTGAFIINYVGSISSAGAIVFLPLLTGLSIGLLFAKGPIMLLMFPLVAAFALMVTALTHQFRGWLASLMANKRRRRTVIAVATLGFMLIVQLPNIIGFTSGRWGGRPGSAQSAAAAKEIQDLDRALAKREITREEHRQRTRQLRRGRPEQNQQNWEEIQRVARVANLVIPAGWLAYGATAAFDGRILPGVLGFLGLSLIGAASLRRSYRTTLRLYTGHFNAKTAALATARAGTQPASPASPASPAPAAASAAANAAFLERKIPFLSEPAAAVALACFRSLARAPEAKMVLLSPLIMVVILGGMFFRQRNDVPELARPLMAAGGFTFVLFMLIGLLGNQFGIERSGFRVYVLAPASRRDILLGKNISLAPFGIGFMTVVAIVVQWTYPMRLDHAFAVLLQIVPMYLVYCMVGNIMSIIAPTPMAAGSMKPHKPKVTTILIHLGFMIVFPIVMALTLIPLGIEFLLSWGAQGWLASFPAYLLFTLAEAALILYLYKIILESQGRLLQRRERKILEVVTTKVE